LAGVYVYLSPGKGGESRETQVWWIASDPHVGYDRGDPIGTLQVGIEDINEYVEEIEGVDVDYAILLGDIIHESNIYIGMFLRAMDNLKVENWYYVLGNHDFQFPALVENLLPPVDMTLDVMGMKWILISDHIGDSYNPTPESRGGTMPENVQEWFVDQVLYSDKPVFVFSHQPPGDWKAWNENLQRLAKGSELQGWFYGHIHAWSASRLEEQVLIFSDCSLDWAKNYKGVLIYLEREGDTVDVTLRFRDHENHTWVEIPFQRENVENISFSVKV